MFVDANPGVIFDAQGAFCASARRLDARAPTRSGRAGKGEVYKGVQNLGSQRRGSKMEILAKIDTKSSGTRCSLYREV